MVKALSRGNGCVSFFSIPYFFCFEGPPVHQGSCRHISSITYHTSAGINMRMWLCTFQAQGTPGGAV